MQSILLKKFESRPYQQKAVDTIEKLFETSNEIVLDAVVNAGKTEMVYELIHRKTGNKFLVLNNKVSIRQQWEKRFRSYGKLLNVDFLTYQTYSRRINKKTADKYDYIVTDEGHGFTGSDTKMFNEKIIPYNSGAKVLYLTGTPARFVKENNIRIAKKEPRIPFVSVNLNDLAEKQYAKVEFKMVDTNANLKAKDWLNNGEIKKSKAVTKIRIKALSEDLDRIIDKIDEETRKTPKIPKLESLLTDLPIPFTKGKKEKALIVVESQDYAQAICDQLHKKGHSVILSTHKNDLRSENLQKFKEDNTRFLVVVHRGKEGYSVPNLKYVIDMSLSKNPITSHQLMGRVLRAHDEIEKKFYIKVSPYKERDWFNVVGLVALNLFLEEFRHQYDGTWRSIYGANIVLIGKNKDKGRNAEVKHKDNNHTPVKIPDLDGAQLIDLWTKNFNKTDRLWNPNSYANIGDLLRNMGKPLKEPEVNKAKIWDWSIKHNKRPSEHTGSVEEKRLGRLISNYTHTSSRSFDPVFTKEYNKQFPPPYKKWTIEELAKDALNYKTRKEWESKNRKAYGKAVRLGIVDELCAHMDFAYKTWTEEEILKDALNYKTRKEWMVGNSSAYQKAKRLGVFEKACAHMGLPITRKRTIKNIDTNDIYPSIREAARLTNISINAINKVLAKKIETAGGYRWVYID